MVHRKPDEERQRRNKPRYLQHCLEWDGVTRGPELPESYEWCKETRRWYNEFRDSPNAQLCEDTDWEHIFIVALLHNKLWQNRGKDLSPSEMTNLSKEIRTRMSPYGYTNEDRLRLNIEISAAADEDRAETRPVDTKINYEALLTPPVEQ